MTMPLENVERFYQSYITSRYDREILDHFLALRAVCEPEITAMNRLVQKLKPAPSYRHYGGAVRYYKESSPWYLFHSATYSTLTFACRSMQEIDNGFVVDQNSQIILSQIKNLLPITSIFTPEVRTPEVYRLPMNHQAILLSELAEQLFTKNIDNFGDYPLRCLMLAEGFQDNMNEVVAALDHKNNEFLESLLPPSDNRNNSII